MADDFIEFYNYDKSIFANGTGFYQAIEEPEATEEDGTEDVAITEVSSEGQDTTPEQEDQTGPGRVWMYGIIAVVILAGIAGAVIIVNSRRKR